MPCSILIDCATGVGGALGTALYQAAFSSKLAQKLPNYIIAAVLPLGFDLEYIGGLIGAAANGDVTIAEGLPGITPQIIEAAFGAAAQAFADSCIDPYLRILVHETLTLCFFYSPLCLDRLRESGGCCHCRLLCLGTH